MQFFLFPFRLLYKIYFAIYFALSMVFFYPLFFYFLSREERFPIGFKIMRTYAVMWLFFMGVKLKIKGQENLLRNQAFVTCSNHSSYLDIPCYYALMNQYFVFVGKKEFEKWPIFKLFGNSGMNIFVDRYSRIGALKGYKRMVEAVANGNVLAVFPEGTISKNAPQLTEFKSGPVAVAINQQVPILPITFLSNWKRLQRKGLWSGSAGPGYSHIVIHPAISTKGLNKDDVDRTVELLKEVISGPLKREYDINNWSN